MSVTISRYAWRVLLKYKTVTSITAAVKFLFKIESQLINSQTKLPSLLMQLFKGT